MERSANGFLDSENWFLEFEIPKNYQILDFGTSKLAPGLVHNRLVRNRPAPSLLLAGCTMPPTHTAENREVLIVGQ